jgi:hypothetical protein
VESCDLRDTRDCLTVGAGRGSDCLDLDFLVIPDVEEGLIAGAGFVTLGEEGLFEVGVGDLECAVRAIAACGPSLSEITRCDFVPLQYLHSQSWGLESYSHFACGKNSLIDRKRYSLSELSGPVRTK